MGCNTRIPFRACGERHEIIEDVITGHLRAEGECEELRLDVTLMTQAAY